MGFASCGFFDAIKCAAAVGIAFLECKNAGSAFEVVKCIAEKVASNSACKDCFCDAVCKVAPQEICDICPTILPDFNLLTVLPKILIQADGGLTFPVNITTITYQNAPACPAENEKVKLDPLECSPPITRGDCLITSIQAVRADSPNTPCTSLISNEGSSESRFVVKSDGTTGCQVVQETNSC